jgi:hypothetical protein
LLEAADLRTPDFSRIEALVAAANPAGGAIAPVNEDMDSQATKAGWGKRTALALAAAVLVAPSLQASHPAGLPNDHQYEILDELAATQAQVAAAQSQLSALDADLASLTATVGATASAVGALRNAVTLTVLVDTAACTTGASECTSGGHTAVAASSANHNPVQLIVLATRAGQPVAELSGFMVDLYAPGNAPGTSAFLCGCPLDAAGVYRLWVHPSGVWKAGSYEGYVRVLDDGFGAVRWTIA